MTTLDKKTDTKIDLVKVDKSARTLTLFVANTAVGRYHVALGPYPQGHKHAEGDGRTPEGEYTLDYKKEDSAFYRAMHISYPNAQDLANAEARGQSAGGFIMVHGQHNGQVKDKTYARSGDWTQGCIALSNAEMDEFMEQVDVGTKILIVKSS